MRDAPLVGRLEGARETRGKDDRLARLEGSSSIDARREGLHGERERYLPRHRVTTAMGPTELMQPVFEEILWGESRKPARGGVAGPVQ